MTTFLLIIFILLQYGTNLVLCYMLFGHLDNKKLLPKIFICVYIAEYLLGNVLVSLDMLSGSFKQGFNYVYALFFLGFYISMPLLYFSARWIFSFLDKKIERKEF